MKTVGTGEAVFHPELERLGWATVAGLVTSTRYSIKKEEPEIDNETAHSLALERVSIEIGNGVTSSQVKAFHVAGLHQARAKNKEQRKAIDENMRAESLPSLDNLFDDSASERRRRHGRISAMLSKMLADIAIGETRILVVSQAEDLPYCHTRTAFLVNALPGTLRIQRRSLNDFKVYDVHGAVSAFAIKRLLAEE